MATNPIFFHLFHISRKPLKKKKGGGSLGKKAGSVPFSSVHKWNEPIKNNSLPASIQMSPGDWYVFY